MCMYSGEVLAPQDSSAVWPSFHACWSQKRTGAIEPLAGCAQTAPLGDPMEMASLCFSVLLFLSGRWSKNGRYRPYMAPKQVLYWKNTANECVFLYAFVIFLGLIIGLSWFVFVLK